MNRTNNLDLTKMSQYEKHTTQQNLHLTTVNLLDNSNGTV